MSIPFWSEDWKPDSFYDKIQANLERGFHTLCLLDIKVAERSIENMMKNRKIFEPPRFMTVSQAVDQLLKISQSRGDDAKIGKAIFSLKISLLDKGRSNM